MTLSNRQIKSAITGAVRTVESNNGICAKRFTEKQEAVFALRHPNFPEDFFDGYFERNCATGAGITLDFVTDSADVTFCIAENSPINGSETSCFEIYVNGTKRTGADKPGEYTVSLRGESRVTLYYPYFACLVISGITLCDGSSFRPVRQTKSWLALGDSITHGINSSFPSETYPMRISRKYGVSVLNQGNSGYVCDARIIDPDIGFVPDVVTTAYGINDLGRKPHEQNRADLAEYLKTLKDAFPHSRLYVISPIYAASLDSEERAGDREWLYGTFAEVTAEVGLPLIDGRKLVPNNEKYLFDGVHPNDAGFSYYASRLGRLLFK